MRRRNNSSNNLRPARRSTAPASSQQQDDVSMEVDPATGPLVRLKTNDGKRFTLTEAEASCSNALKQMIEHTKSDTNVANLSSGDYIHLDFVNGPTFSILTQWFRAHSCPDQAPLTSTLLAPDITNDLNGSNTQLFGNASDSYELTQWDRDFLESFGSEEDLLRLMHVANYLDVKSLMNACCQLIAKRWESKKVEDIRKMLNIRGDFSQDEENHMIQENKKLGLPE